jgi:hypothetical protein
VRYNSLYPDNAELVPPLVLLFPKVTSCTYGGHGVSGSIEKFHAKCLLPLNVLNEKIFLVLWFWYAVLICLSILQLLIRLSLFALPCKYFLAWYCHCRLRKHAYHLAKNFSFGQRFQLIQISKNVTTAQFDQLIEILARLDFSRFAVNQSVLLLDRHLVLVSDSLGKYWVCRSRRKPSSSLDPVYID